MGGVRSTGVTSSREAYRRRSTDVAIEGSRAACALLGVLALAAASVPDDMRTAAVLAHVAVLGGSLLALALVPFAVRHGQAAWLAMLPTAGTLVFFVAYSAAWHDVPHSGSLLGVLALLEAPIRYGLRGIAFSAPPVTGAALIWPQTDAAGDSQGPVMVVVLVVVLCTLVLVVRETSHRTARALASAAEGFADATLHLPLGVAVLDAGGRVMQANPALEELVGGPAEGALLSELLPRAASPRLAQLLAGDTPDERVQCPTADGRWLEVGACRLQVPGPSRTVVHVQDVTAARQERADLLHASRHDALTGLLLRSAGQELLEQALSLPGDTGSAVLFLDLDGFKRLNDTAGHAVGDAVLRQAAARLAGSLRPGEQAVRWGGDEFVVVCRHVEDDAAVAAVAERLLRVLREPFRVQDAPLLALTGSLGAVLCRPGEEADGVIAMADRAMYEAKSMGGDGWVRGGPAAVLPDQRPAPQPLRVG